MKHFLLCLVAIAVAQETVFRATGSPLLTMAVILPATWWLAGLSHQADLEARS